jgi:hypothetical protein
MLNSGGKNATRVPLPSLASIRQENWEVVATRIKILDEVNCSEGPARKERAVAEDLPDYVPYVRS